MPVDLTDDLFSDLTPVRAASREKFAGVADGSALGPMEPLKPLIQVLPDRLLARAARNAANKPVLCTSSNVGELPDGLVGLGGAPAARIMCRTVTQNLTRDRAYRAGGGLTVWLAGLGDRMSLTVQTLDVDRVADAAQLQKAVDSALTQIGVTGRAW